MTCDVCVRSDIDHLVEETVSRFGPPDILVNNAHGNLGPSATDDSGLEHITEATMTDVFRGGVLASLFGMQACFPYMKRARWDDRQHGLAERHRRHSPPHRVRHGQGGDPRADQARRPGVGTPWHHRQRGLPGGDVCRHAAYRDADPARFETILGSIPLRYMGDPVDDIAPAVLALATDLRYLTGATLMLDGGMCILR